MAVLDNLFRVALNEGVDELILEPGQRPWFSRNGSRIPVGRRELDGPALDRLLAEVVPSAEAGVGRALGKYQFGYRVDEWEFQVEGTATPSGWRIVARPQPAAAAQRPVPAAGASPLPVAANGTAPAPAPPAPAPLRAVPAQAGPQPIPSLTHLLELMLERKASDLHLSSGQPPRLRVDGDLDPLDSFAVPSSQRMMELLDPVLPERNRQEFEGRNDTDFAHELPGKSRFRVNVFRDRLGIGAVIRTISERIPSAEELGLPEVVRDLANLSKGLVLVTGPTGSGKSTTLAAIVDLINRTRRDHIITIEDPVEYVHTSKRCMVNQREVGSHTGSFKQALRAALREDPDVVLVGELRDLETISIAIETAETGHLVFGTLHTTTASSTVERLVDQYPGDQQGQIRMMLAGSLRAVIAQSLLKKIGGGRVAAFEILLGTPAVSNLIREAKTPQIPSAMQTSKGQGMMLLNDSLCALVKKGLVEPAEAYLKAVFKDTLLHRLRGDGISLDFLKDLKAEAPL